MNFSNTVAGLLGQIEQAELEILGWELTELDGQAVRCDVQDVDGWNYLTYSRHIEQAELEILGWELEELEELEMKEASSSSDVAATDRNRDKIDHGISDCESQHRRLGSNRKSVREAAIAAIYPMLIGVYLSPGLPSHVIDSAADIVQRAKMGESPRSLGFKRFRGGGGKTATHGARVGIRHRILALVNDDGRVDVVSVIPREAYQGAKIVR